LSAAAGTSIDINPQSHRPNPRATPRALAGPAITIVGHVIDARNLTITRITLDLLQPAPKSGPAGALSGMSHFSETAFISGRAALWVCRATMKANQEPRKPFLTAEWRWLAMVNYEVPPEILMPWLPQGVELDLWQGRSLVSLVGFRFLKTRVMGLTLPGHRDFDEVNLRFYVRRRMPDGWRRGVVFVRELVPRPMIALVARAFYDEPYLSVPMRHRIEPVEGPPSRVEYAWDIDGRSCHLRVETSGAPRPLRGGEEAEFISEHYWGYTKRRNGSTSEYEVAHPPWRVMEADATSFHAPVADLYGEAFCESLAAEPTSAFLAEGSEVTVYRGRRLV